MRPAPTNMYAAGSISTCRIVIPSTTHDHAAAQAANGNVLPLGISQHAGRLNPDPNYSQSDVDVAAIAGETVGIHGPGSGDVLLYCNFAWNQGDLLMSDANGKGILCTTGKYYVGRAKTDGVVDSLCPVDVITGLMP